MSKPTPSESARKSQTRQDREQDGFLDQLFVWLDASLVCQTAGELVRGCQSTILRQFREKVAGLPLAEAKGHIQTTILDVLRQEVDGVLQRRSVRASLRERILHQAAEQIAATIAKDLARSRPHRNRLRAA